MGGSTGQPKMRGTGGSNPSPSSGESANFRFLSVEAASRTAAVINAAPRLRAANSCETMYQVAQVYRFREFLTGQLLATFLDLLTLAGLCHGNSIEHALRPRTHYASCRCDGISPLCGRFGPEDPQCGSGDEVALEVEGVVNRTVHAEKALGGLSRPEPLQLALASSDSLMRILYTIILCALTRCTVLPGERPGRQTLAPAGSTRGGSGGDEWSEAL